MVHYLRKKELSAWVHCHDEMEMGEWKGGETRGSRLLKVPVFGQSRHEAEDCFRQYTLFCISENQFCNFLHFFIKLFKLTPIQLLSSSNTSPRPGSPPGRKVRDHWRHIWWSGSGVAVFVSTQQGGIALTTHTPKDSGYHIAWDWLIEVIHRVVC